MAVDCVVSAICSSSSSSRAAAAAKINGTRVSREREIHYQQQQQQQRRRFSSCVRRGVRRTILPATRKLDTPLIFRSFSLLLLLFPLLSSSCSIDTNTADNDNDDDAAAAYSSPAPLLPYFVRCTTVLIRRSARHDTTRRNNRAFLLRPTANFRLQFGLFQS